MKVQGRGGGLHHQKEARDILSSLICLVDAHCSKGFSFDHSSNKKPPCNTNKSISSINMKRGVLTRNETKKMRMAYHANPIGVGIGPLEKFIVPIEVHTALGIGRKHHALDSMAAAGLQEGRHFIKVHGRTGHITTLTRATTTLDTQMDTEMEDIQMDNQMDINFITPRTCRGAIRLAMQTTALTPGDFMRRIIATTLQEEEEVEDMEREEEEEEEGETNGVGMRHPHTTLTGINQNTSLSRGHPMSTRKRKERESESESEKVIKTTNSNSNAKRVKIERVTGVAAAAKEEEEERGAGVGATARTRMPPVSATLAVKGRPREVVLLSGSALMQWMNAVQTHEGRVFREMFTEMLENYWLLEGQLRHQAKRGLLALETQASLASHTGRMVGTVLRARRRLSCTATMKRDESTHSRVCKTLAKALQGVQESPNAAGRADVESTNWVVEVKPADQWTHGLGQVHAYGFSTGKDKLLVLFGRSKPPANCLECCADVGIHVLFLNENLSESCWEESIRSFLASSRS